MLSTAGLHDELPVRQHLPASWECKQAKSLHAKGPESCFGLSLVVCVFMRLTLTCMPVSVSVIRQSGSTPIAYL